LAFFICDLCHRLSILKVLQTLGFSRRYFFQFWRSFESSKFKTEIQIMIELTYIAINKVKRHLNLNIHWTFSQMRSQMAWQVQKVIERPASNLWDESFSLSVVSVLRFASTAIDCSFNERMIALSEYGLETRECLFVWFQNCVIDDFLDRDRFRFRLGFNEIGGINWLFKYYRVIAFILMLIFLCNVLFDIH